MEDLIAGHDGVLCVAKLRVGKYHLDRVVQHLYPLELSCDVSKPKNNTPNLDRTVQAFKPKRDAAAAAMIRFQEIAKEKEKERESLNLQNKKFIF